jgi:acetyltransferase-like isoleucine patch superfamily enzyme
LACTPVIDDRVSTAHLARWKQAVQQPRRALAVLVGLTRGFWYKFWLPIRGQRFKAGRNFRIYDHLDVRGPGLVSIGNDVEVYGYTTAWTHREDAKILVGDYVMLSGTRIGCVERVEIGGQCLLANCHLMDSDFHSIRADRRSADAPIRTQPIIVGRNVWIAAQAIVLPGCSVGEDSVVAAGAVVTRPVPAGVVVAGNPARTIAEVPGPEMLVTDRK